jgi:hypothetical protein
LQTRTETDSPLHRPALPSPALPTYAPEWDDIRERILSLPSHNSELSPTQPSGDRDCIGERDAILPTDDGIETQKLESAMDQARERDEAGTWSHWFQENTQSTTGGYSFRPFVSRETSNASSRSVVDSDDVEPPWETSSVVESSVVGEIPLRLPPGYRIQGRPEAVDMADTGPEPSAAV